METSTAQQHDRRKERSGRASGKRETKKMGHPYIYRDDSGGVGWLLSESLASDALAGRQGRIGGY
jgi:hypothetical protein